MCSIFSPESLAGFFAVLAIWKRHERSFLVYLALIPAALATFLVLGEILYLIVFVLTGRQIHYVSSYELTQIDYEN